MTNPLHQLETEAAAKLAHTVPRDNVLQFSLVRQVLWGQIAGTRYGPVPAYSGGGQTGVRAANLKIKDWAPQKQKSSSGRGGCLGPGWWIVIPEQLAKGHYSSHLRAGGAPTNMSMRLVPYQLDKAYHDNIRGAFYIHGTGGHGSDGCILIDPTNRQTLVKLVCSHGGAWLRAFISGQELNEKIEQSIRFSHTA